MTDQQKIKILNVMHTLGIIRDGKAIDIRLSAKACWEVLDEVLKMTSVAATGRKE